MAAGMYVATCERDGPAWIVSIAELGCSTRVTRLGQVEDSARSLVHTYTRGNPNDIPVIVELVVGDGVRAVLDEAEEVRDEIESLAVGAVRRRSAVARRLAAEGFPVRDVAYLLGVSYGRAQQLVGDRRVGLPAPRGPGRTGGRPARGPSSPLHDSYRHEAFVYRTSQDFLAGTVPFIREGVAFGQPVMVAVKEPRLALIREALGADSGQVRFVDMSVLGLNPARIIPAWLDFVQESEADGRPLRGIGEPIWAGRRPEEVVECQIHEALLNVAVSPDSPLWLRCPYDAAALDGDLMTEAMRSHPSIVEEDDFRGSPAYGGVQHALDLMARPLAAAPHEAFALRFDRLGVSDVRRHVGRLALEAGLGADQTADLELVSAELAANSVRHGGGGGRLRVWREPGAFVCEVSDSGVIGDPLVGRHRPSVHAQHGRGVWLAHQLSDLVQIRSQVAGTTVRVLTWT